MPECTVYDYLWKSNKDHLNRTALQYLERKITFRKMFENIEKTAKAFTATMMLGYYKNPEATKEVIWEHPDGKWVHTGDIGYVDKNGFVFIVDRIKRIIPRSGYKVFPSEIENLFLQHKAVLQCAVVAIPDVKDISAPKAHIVLKEEYKEQSAIVRKELLEMFKKSALPPYFEPIDYKFREELPLTKIGKIDFRELQKEK